MWGYHPFRSCQQGSLSLPKSETSVGFGKRGLFRKVHFLEILENLKILEKFLTVEKNGEYDHFLEILENLESLEILEILPVKSPLS